MVANSSGAGTETEDGVRRRDFIHVGTLAFAGVGTVAAVWPMISQMSPSADVRALSSTDVDLSPIEAGQGIMAVWRQTPIFVRKLTQKEQDEANAVPLSKLRDPETLAERTRPGHQEWLITLAVCTHLGCVPLGIKSDQQRGDYGGYFCPCHGSQYDTAARIRSGPAPLNLQVPPYEFTTPTLIKIG